MNADNGECLGLSSHFHNGWNAYLIADGFLRVLLFAYERLILVNG